MKTHRKHRLIWNTQEQGECIAQSTATTRRRKRLLQVPLELAIVVDVVYSQSRKPDLIKDKHLQNLYLWEIGRGMKR